MKIYKKLLVIIFLLLSFNSLAQEKMIQCNENREWMGQNAKIDMKRYSPENIMAKWDNLFKKMI